MFEFLCPTSRQYRTITKTEMGSVVQDRDIALAQQTRNCAKRAAKSAVEQHRILAVEKFRDAPFEFAVKIGHALKHRRTACPHTMGPQGLVPRSKHVGVIR